MDLLADRFGQHNFVTSHDPFTTTPIAFNKRPTFLSVRTRSSCGVLSAKRLRIRQFAHEKVVGIFIMAEKQRGFPTDTDRLMKFYSLQSPIFL